MAMVGGHVTFKLCGALPCFPFRVRAEPRFLHQIHENRDRRHECDRRYHVAEYQEALDDLSSHACHLLGMLVRKIRRLDQDQSSRRA
jgi:hypothetical protein